MSKFAYCALALLLLLGTGGRAEAQTVVDCTSNSSALQTTLDPNTWPGGGISIKGTCIGSVQIYATTSFTGDLTQGGTIEGQIEVFGSGLECQGPSVSTGTVTLDGTGTAANTAVIWAHDAAAVIVDGCTVQNGTGDGILADKNTLVNFQSGTVEDNGTNPSGGAHSHGIEGLAGASIWLGETTYQDVGTNPGGSLVTISGNSGDGIHLTNGANLYSLGTVVDGNGQNAVYLSNNASARFQGGSITAPSGGFTPPAWAIQVLAASSLRLEGVNSSAASATAPNGALFVAAASSAILNSTILWGNSTSAPVVEATGSASVFLAGGNTITVASGGTAMEADHSSSLYQVPPANYGYTAAVETITGAGLVQEQSSADLGQGQIGGTTQSMTWTGGFLVQQNSSFRMSGGVTVTGQILLQQGSNGFVNTLNPGTNTVQGGIQCPSTSFPASHVSGASNVTGTVTLATSPSSVTSPQCMTF
jgi:hypothetical protein